MMGKERALLDKTMRQRQGSGDPKDGGAQGLSKQQGDLKNEMDQMLQGLDPKLKGALDEAGKAMENAQRALGSEDLDNAGNEEKNALDALRKGADALAQAAGAAERPDGRKARKTRWAAANRRRRQWASNCRAPATWRGPVASCRNCANAPANGAARNRNWIIWTGC